MSMKCEDCDQPAKVHTFVCVGGTKREIHLCRACAEKKQLYNQDAKIDEQAVVAQYYKPNVGGLTGDLMKLACPDCGITWMEFRKAGRMGCPNDYAVFHDALLPLLERVHRAAAHAGKRPARHAALRVADELRQLRTAFRAAAAAEDFETAARLRDQIRQKDSQHAT